MILPPLLRRNRTLSIGLAVLCLLFLGSAGALLVRKTPSVTPPLPPQAASVAEPAAQTPVAELDPILDLFNPSESEVEAQHTTTALEQQIENALLISFVLKGCNEISDREYARTYETLVHYALRMQLASTLAEADALVRRIGESAAASYALIYSRTSCNDPRLEAVEDQLEEWRETMDDQAS